MTLPECLVRIPLSTRRGGFAKLLTRVSLHARTGFDFEGTLLQPGSWISRATLPNSAILLEMAPHPSPAHGHLRYQQGDVYLLWRYNPDHNDWTQIVSITAPGWAWPAILAPLAIAALQ